MKHLTVIFLMCLSLFIIISSCNEDINDGLTSLVNVMGESAGENCSSGGYRIETGIDINNNTVLDSSEVQNLEYICNGNNGFTSLINVTGESAGENCSSGGYRIETGVDINNNAVLDSNEVQIAEYICNGNNGFTSLVNATAESAGVNCSTGGYKLETGIDINNNGVLESGEVQIAEYICNGNEGLTSLVNVTIESPGVNCSSGGYKIETGIDINSNGILESPEVQNSEYTCNGDESYFGETQTGFKSNSVYQANSDGFLLVQYTSKTLFGNIDGYIYSDNSENPIKIIGEVNFVPGSTCVPIQKNNYWKVASVENTIVLISWIPILK